MIDEHGEDCSCSYELSEAYGELKAAIEKFIQIREGNDSSRMLADWVLYASSIDFNNRGIRYDFMSSASYPHTLEGMSMLLNNHLIDMREEMREK